VPIVVKDLDGGLAGEPFHWGNGLLKGIGHTAARDSYLFAKLRHAGFVIVGKTNCPEFGLLPTTEPTAYGASRNPWSTDHSPGGSSGGTGAAVAAGMVPLGHAGDGGGSIRIPASMVRLFGLKPTRGRVSLGPDEGESWSGLVVRHVLTRSVRDSAAVLDVIAGAMPGDPYAAAPPRRPFADEVGDDPGAAAHRCGDDSAERHGRRRPPSARRQSTRRPRCSSRWDTPWNWCSRKHSATAA
jgi:amidase